MQALEFKASHVIYNPAYTYKFQLKPTLTCNDGRNICNLCVNDCNISSYIGNFSILGSNISRISFDTNLLNDWLIRVC